MGKWYRFKVWSDDIHFGTHYFRAEKDAKTAHDSLWRADSTKWIDDIEEVTDAELEAEERATKKAA